MFRAVGAAGRCKHGRNAAARLKSRVKSGGSLVCCLGVADSRMLCRLSLQAGPGVASAVSRSARSLATVMLLVSSVVAGLRTELPVLAVSRPGRAGKIAA
jgi:hypothetical protein